jgi:hypothetical protein
MKLAAPTNAFPRTSDNVLIFLHAANSKKTKIKY